MRETRVASFALLSSTVLAVAACGSESASDGADGMPGGTQSGAGGGTSGTGTGAGAAGAATGGSSATSTGSGGDSATGTGGDTTTGVGGGDAATGTGGTAGDTGGAGSGGMVDPGDLEPPPGEYGERANLLASNSEFAVAEADGKIYVLGGYPSSPSETQTAVYVYDIAADAWSEGDPLPTPIHHPVAVGVEGKIYSLGGQTPGGDTDLTLVHDPAIGGWEELAPMPTARGAGAAAVIGDVIYVVAGRPPAAGNAFEAYDISEDDWDDTLPPLPMTFADRNHLIATAIGDKVYVAGGRYDGGGFTSPMTASLDIFDPATGMWTQGESMPRERGGINGVAAYGCFYVWGGEGSNTGLPNDVFPDHDVYDQVADDWISLDPLPTPIHGVTGAAFYDGLIYIPGGGLMSGGSSGSNVFQVYRPDVRCE